MGGAAMTLQSFCTLSGIKILIIEAVEISLQIVAGQILNWVAMMRMKLSLFRKGGIAVHGNGTTSTGN